MYTCGRCGETSNDVEERYYSYGYYAGRFCRPCAIAAYSDACGLRPEGQGDPTTLHEYEAGGWDAIDGETLSTARPTPTP